MASSESESKEHTTYEQFFRMTTDLCAIADFEGYFKIVSPSWTATLGYSEQELITRKFLDFVHPEDRERTVQEAAQIADGQIWSAFENRYLCKDGSVRWLQWRSNVDKERQIIFATARDITEEKNQQEKLNALDRRTTTLLETITDGFMSIDSQWRLTYANPKALKLWGRSEGIGKPIDHTITDFFESAFHKRVEEALVSGEQVEFEEHYMPKDMWFKVTVYPNPQGVSLFLRDVTESKMVEQKMREQHEMLVQASKLASLGEMAGGIAHEINTPLAVILLNIELLSELNQAETPDREKAARLLQSTTVTVGRISQIVKGLKTFARDAKQEPTVTTSVAEIVAETLELCVPKFKTGRLSVQRPEIDPGLTVECRSIQISQVLLNLLNNAYDAVEALPERWVRIECSDKGETVEIAVVDSGAGIREAIRQKIMEPFFTTKPSGKGTGLGLSISIGIVKDHGGELILDGSSANTKFVIRLPKHQTSQKKLPA